MTAARASTLLRGASLLALVGLALMIWSIFDPRPPAVLIALTVGQGLGTLSFLMYLVVVVADLRRHRVQSDAPDDGPGP